MMQLKALISLQDMLSGPLKKVHGAMDNFENQTKIMNTGLKKASGEMDVVSGRTGKMSSAFGSLTTTAAGLSGALAGVGAGMVAMNSVNLAMDFESQLSTISALTGLAGKEMAEMKDLALEMGAQTKYEECFTAA